MCEGDGGVEGETGREGQEGERGREGIFQNITFFYFIFNDFQVQA